MVILIERQWRIENKNIIQVQQQCDREAFNAKKLNDVKEKYQVQIERRFAASESADSNPGWRNIVANNKISANQRKSCL
jgi:hypothetical protein